MYRNWTMCTEKGAHAPFSVHSCRCLGRKAPTRAKQLAAEAINRTRSPDPMPIPDLESVLGSRNKVRILRALALAEGEAPVSGREAMNLAGLSSSGGAWSALGELAETGVVRRRSTGGAHLYALNPDHLLARPLMRLFQAEAGSEDAMGRALETELVRCECPTPSVVFLVPAALPPGNGASAELLIVAVDADGERRTRRALPELLGSLARRVGAIGRAEVTTLEGLHEGLRRGEPLFRRFATLGRAILGAVPADMDRSPEGRVDIP